MFSLSDITPIVALIISAMALWLNLKGDTKNDQSAMTTVIVKLENITDLVKETKTEIKDIKADNEKVKERITVVEQSLINAHKRIDSIHAEHITEE